MSWIGIRSERSRRKLIAKQQVCPLSLILRSYSPHFEWNWGWLQKRHLDGYAALRKRLNHKNDSNNQQRDEWSCFKALLRRSRFFVQTSDSKLSFSVNLIDIRHCFCLCASWALSIIYFCKQFFRSRAVSQNWKKKKLSKT